MSYNTFRLWKAVIVVIIAISVSASVVAGYAFVPVPVAALGAAVMLLLRRRVREIVVDERTWRIADRAGRLAYQAGAVIMALLAATFLALDRAGNSGLGETGLTLAYTAAGLLVIYYIAYLYYNRKLGGE
jgi:uncharacterized membrane protein